jgi:hypothetical protein
LTLVPPGQSLRLWWSSPIAATFEMKTASDSRPL